MRPRAILCGESHLVTRRCSEQRFFLLPSNRTNQIFEYIVAVMAERTGVQIHSLCVMSNHWHCTATDPQGRMPEFIREVHAKVGRHLNYDMEREGHFWSGQQTSLVRVRGDEDILARHVYTMVNPVKAGLVAHGSEWPGLRVAWPAQRRPVKRPKGFFLEDGPLPDVATLQLVRPPGFESMTDDELAVRMITAVSQQEEHHRRSRRGSGDSFLGRRGVLKQSPFQASKTRRLRRKISPRVAAANLQRRIAMLAELKVFLDAYRNARLRWSAGERDVEFPPGTYLLRVSHGVRVAPS